LEILYHENKFKAIEMSPLGAAKRVVVLPPLPQGPMSRGIFTFFPYFLHSPGV
jgi:hypothetical protein